MFNSYQYSGSYDDLLKLMTQRPQKYQVDHQILEILRNFFENELGKEHMALSLPERARLFQEVTKAIMADVLGKIDGAK